MPYVLVRESFYNGSCMVEGLPLNEGKVLGIWCKGFIPKESDYRGQRSSFPISYRKNPKDLLR